MTGEPTEKRPSGRCWWPLVLLLSSAGVFVAAALATPSTRQAMAIALMFALLAVGLSVVGLLLFLILIINYSEKMNK